MIRDTSYQYDLDGKCDSYKVFAQHPSLFSPLGICKLGNKLYISQSPNVLVYTIEETAEGPRPAGKPEVVFTGFTGVNHDHGVHAFVFGPDGRYYFNSGNDGSRGVVAYPDGKPVVDVTGSEIGGQGKTHRGKPKGRGNIGYQEGLAYRWDPERSPGECVRGIVPIGEPIGDTRTLVADDGELLLAGPQVTSGYWHDPDRTAEAFVTPPGESQVHYRTGDRVRSGPPLVYLGRTDDQIKVLGHRVELGEVEAALREVAGVDEAVAVGWPPLDSGAGGIAAFVPDPDADPEELRRELAARLPDYMVPRRIELRERLPLNANGKLDRRALIESLG